MLEVVAARRLMILWILMTHEYCIAFALRSSTEGRGKGGGACIC